MSKITYDFIVIGAGLSGLSCALKLQESGQQVLVLEKSDGPGGRVRTDEVDGYLLDRGFQVYLDAYPTAGELFDLKALDLRKFEPGALVFSDQKLHRVMDVFRRPRHLFTSAFAPVGNLFDKALVARLRAHVAKLTCEEIAQGDDLTTADFLRRYGFSERMIDGFFRCFYGGIFLERELRTSSQMFEFTFKMFLRGSATLPANGMGELSRQLAERLGEDHIRYHAQVTDLCEHDIRLSTGEVLTAKKIIIATPPDVTQRLLPALKLPKTSWRSVTNLYFSADQSPLKEAILALNGEREGLTNNVAVLTDISPNYAPKGKALISVSLLGLPEEEDLPAQVIKELVAWFGPEVIDWRHLRTDRIPRALPEQKPGPTPLPEPSLPYFLCGDYQVSASIEGAIISGQQAAQKALAQG